MFGWHSFAGESNERAAPAACVPRCGCNVANLVHQAQPSRGVHGHRLEAIFFTKKILVSRLALKWLD
jgi:hypothetical protein